MDNPGGRTHCEAGVTGCISRHLLFKSFRKYGALVAQRQAMDIARPELKLQKRRRQIVMFGIGAVVVAAVTIGVMRLKRAAPSGERGTGGVGVVRGGPKLLAGRGAGQSILHR